MRPLTTIATNGGQALSGRGAGLAADLSTAAELAMVLAVWIAFARRRAAGAETALLACAAAAAATVAFDKVLSPQYLIWLVPFVLLLGGARRRSGDRAPPPRARPDQLWFPVPYWLLAYNHASPYSWYLLARDLALVALAAILLLELSRERDFAGGEKVGRPLGEPPHEIAVPLRPERRRHENVVAARDEVELQARADAVEHLELEAVARDVVLAREETACSSSDSSCVAIAVNPRRGASARRAASAASTSASPGRRPRRLEELTLDEAQVPERQERREVVLAAAQVRLQYGADVRAPASRSRR